MAQYRSPICTFICPWTSTLASMHPRRYIHYSQTVRATDVMFGIQIFQSMYTLSWPLLWNEQLSPPWRYFLLLPQLWKVGEAYCFWLVHPSVHVYVTLFCTCFNFWTIHAKILKFHIWIPHGKIGWSIFFLVGAMLLSAPRDRIRVRALVFGILIGNEV